MSGSEIFPHCPPPQCRRSGTSTRPGGRRVSKPGVLGGMARPESLLRSSTGGAAFEPAVAGFPRHGHDLWELHPDSRHTDESLSGTGGAVDLLDDSPTLRVERLRSLHAMINSRRTADSAVKVPATKRFAAWSRRYLLLVASADALVGGISAAVPRVDQRHALWAATCGSAALPRWARRLAGRDCDVPRLSP